MEVPSISLLVLNSQVGAPGLRIIKRSKKPAVVEREDGSHEPESTLLRQQESRKGFDRKGAMVLLENTPRVDHRVPGHFENDTIKVVKSEHSLPEAIR